MISILSYEQDTDKVYVALILCCSWIEEAFLFPRSFCSGIGACHGFPPTRLGRYGSKSRCDFPHRLLGGRTLCVPPSNVRFAPCLPFSSFALRPKGPSPLKPPWFACANQNLARFAPRSYGLLTTSSLASSP